MISLQKFELTNTRSFTSNMILYGYYEYRFCTGTHNRRYFINDNEVGHEIFFSQHYYNI